MMNSVNFWLKIANYCSGREANESAPTDHYFHTFAALACVNAFGNTHETAWIDAATKHVKQYIQSTPKGHAVFNRLALLLTRAKLISINDVTLRSLIDKALSQTPNKVPQNASNNWKLVSIVNHFLENNTITQDQEKWIHSIHTKSGAFIDYQKENQLATPLTYHAKMAFWTSWLGEQTKNKTLQEAGEKGAVFLSYFIHEESTGMIYGRTPQSLFGMVHAYLLFAHQYNRTTNPLFAATHRVIKKQLAEMMENDGSLRLTQSSVPTEELDFYIYKDVYNAYAAGMLSSFPVETIPPTPLPDTTFFDKETGLLAIRKGPFFYAMSVSGQHAPGQSYFFTDTRYYGMNPLLLVDRHEIIIPPNTFNRSTQQSPFEPAWTGFCPEVQINNDCFATPVFHKTTVMWHDTGATIKGTGIPRRLDNLTTLANTLRRAIGLITHSTPPPLSWASTPITITFTLNWKTKEITLKSEGKNPVITGIRKTHRGKNPLFSKEQVTEQEHTIIYRTTDKDWKWKWDE